MLYTHGFYCIILLLAGIAIWRASARICSLQILSDSLTFENEELKYSVKGSKVEMARVVNSYHALQKKYMELRDVTSKKIDSLHPSTAVIVTKDEFLKQHPLVFNLSCEQSLQVR